MDEESSLGSSIRIFPLLEFLGGEDFDDLAGAKVDGEPFIFIGIADRFGGDGLIP